jgi:zinc protease
LEEAMNNTQRTVGIVLAIGLLICSLGGMPLLAVEAPTFISMPSQSPLVQIALMFRTGSISDPAGKEGLAHLTAYSLLEGGFTDHGRRITKEDLALITRPWGGGASPSVLVAKEATTFYMTVPSEVMDRYISRVLAPMMTAPLFEEPELNRLRSEALNRIQGSLRLEDIETLGLEALDHYVLEGTPYAHLTVGSVQGLRRIGRDDLTAFYRSHYRLENLVIGISSDDPRLKEQIMRAVEPMGRGDKPAAPVSVPRAQPPTGRKLTIIAVPNAEASGIHAGFPIEVTRAHPDFWPLYVANVFFGTHRDSFSRLYQEIRQKRGYNYGNYSYIEHFTARPYHLFPPFNTPRRQQYFSIWIRPIAHDHVAHLMKALTYELEEFIRSGMTPAQVEMTKNKARVLYLNLAETFSRLLTARLDDVFYGMKEGGFLEEYLDRIEAVTPDQVNAAIRRHLQAVNLKYLVVTADDRATVLARQIADGGRAKGKSLEEYRIPTVEHAGQTVHAISGEWLEIIQTDAAWSVYPLGLTQERIRVVPVERVFETGDFVAPGN